MHEESTTRPIVFSDLNCPFCFVLNEWLHEHGYANEVWWRGIEHEPEIDVPPAPTERQLAELRAEVEDVSRRAPAVVIKRPSRRPNSRRAIAAVAMAHELLPDEEPALRRAIFRALWHDGRDFSEDAVLSALLRPYGLDLAAVDGHLDAVAAATQKWRVGGFNRIPVVVAPTGTIRSGLGDREGLEQFMGSALFDSTREGACKGKP